MSQIAESFLVLDPQHTDTAFGLAVAAELRHRYPHNTSGLVAQRMRCTKKGAENVLAGHLSARTITMVLRAFGIGLLIDAGARVTGETLEQFIRSRAADARREAAYWAALEEEEEAPRAPPDPPAGHHRALPDFRGGVGP